jgi:glutamate racemase
MMGQGHLPIGVFDSGIGGLTVLRVIHQALPAESTIYLGDTARVPYGTKSPEVVTRYALNNARFLVERGIKLLVVACNTASAVVLPALEEELDVPVVGVIRPGARKAAETTRSGVVGVIGTEGTIMSGSYERALLEIRPGTRVHKRPCPLFVPLAEEGWDNHPVSLAVAQDYLHDFASGGMDTLILGCTHYPVLIPAIEKAVGAEVALVDSATSVAEAVAQELGRLDLTCPGDGPPVREFFVTDVPQRFQTVGERFLGARLFGIKQVDIDPHKPPNQAVYC